MLFALKHEGINLSILAQTLPRIPVEEFERALQAAPNGIYIRKASFLREAFTGEQLAQHSPSAGPSSTCSIRSATSQGRAIGTRSGELNSMALAISPTAPPWSGRLP